MDLRNICIIAHVDHGKTTLVDHLLKQSGSFKSHEVLSDRMMDSGDLEKERGITILAKNTSVRVGDTKINIVDTPGHADFGGEVERIMGMVDGSILLIDAAEGPLPQTRFVLQKSLQQGHKVILVVNKVDRPEVKVGNRIQDVINQAFDLFIELGATEDQAHFPIVYACGKQGWCTTDFDAIPELIAGTKQSNLKPLFDIVLKEIPKPKLRSEPDLQMVIANLSYSDYVGRLAIGRILSGTAKKNQKIIRHGVSETTGAPLKQNFVITQVLTYEGLKMTEVPEAVAGDIAVIAGCELAEIGDTFAGSDQVSILPRITVEKPTISMIFSVNTSPLAGKEGEAIQSRKLRERLLREVRNNVALKFEETPTSDQFRLLGRGELQLAILIEQMRRENFEFMVGKPVVLFQTGENGERLEPMELAVLDMPEEFTGEVTRLFQERKGILNKFETHSHNESTGKARARIEIEIPSRGLLGMRSRYLTATKGDGLFSTQFLGYQPYKGEIPHRTTGSLISDRTGTTVEYGLLNLEDRGVLFFGSGVQVYEGMIVGENNKENDLNVNPCREKKLTNIRSAGAEFLVTLAGTKKMSLEQTIEWIDEDEWIEVTPKSIRIRKKVLPLNLRSVKRSDRVQ